MTTARGPGEIGDDVEDRLRTTENKVGRLEDWRTAIVDPHIKRAEPFIPEVREFIAIFKAVEDERKEARQVELQLRDTQHKQNLERSNIQLVGIAIATLVGTAILVLLGWLALKPQHSFFPPSTHGSITMPETARFAGGIGNAHF